MHMVVNSKTSDTAAAAAAFSSSASPPFLHPISDQSWQQYLPFSFVFLRLFVYIFLRVFQENFNGVLAYCVGTNKVYKCNTP